MMIKYIVGNIHNIYHKFIDCATIEKNENVLIYL